MNKKEMLFVIAFLIILFPLLLVCKIALGAEAKVPIRERIEARFLSENATTDTHKQRIVNEEIQNDVVKIPVVKIPIIEIQFMVINSLCRIIDSAKNRKGNSNRFPVKSSGSRARSKTGNICRRVRASPRQYPTCVYQYSRQN
ncbi:hypothetical protein ES708_10279 [subsurface metagenome]